MKRVTELDEDGGIAISIENLKSLPAKDVWLTHSPFGSPTID